MTTYLPRHERRRSTAYYTIRTIVRGIFWTTVVTGSTALGIASIWVLWAYVSTP